MIKGDKKEEKKDPKKQGKKDPKKQGKSDEGVKAQLRKKIEQKSLQEQIIQMPLQNIENQRLNDVFVKLCKLCKPQGKQGEKQKQKQEKDESEFGFEELAKVLQILKYKYTKPQVEKMIWEVDQNLDKKVDRAQFQLMYKRCVFDKTGLQPRNLFNLVQFLMYDKNNRGTITVQDTLQLIYVRHGDKMNETIKHIFGDKQITQDGQQRQITFQQYLTQIRKRDLMIRKKLQAQRKKVSEPEKKES